jgi:ubiquinone/menaquinone biosynthesis C-methylase UbiE
MYELGQVPTFFAPWAERLLGPAAPQPGERVLDVGTGTGIVARRVAPLVRGSNGASGKVVGVDFNPDMLRVARAAAAREGAQVEWREGRAEKLPFENASFDLVLSQFALMFFSDPRAALQEMNRVLTDQGRLVFSVFQNIDRHPFYQKLDEVLERRFRVSGVGDIFSLGDADRLRALVKQSGFRNIDIQSTSMTTRWQDPEQFLEGEITLDTAAIPSMQHMDEQARMRIVREISKEMEEPLREVTEGNFVVLPFHAFFVRATK